MDTVHVVGNLGEPAFQNAWVNYDGAYPTGRYAHFRKYPDGRVRLTGCIKSGANGTVVFTLPVGYRPMMNHAFSVGDSGGTAICAVGTDGTVLMSQVVGSVTTFCYLDGIEFDTESVSAYTTGLVQIASPAFVTILPPAPVDGQEIYYQADATNGIVWHFRYNAASASPYKWEWLGGSRLWAAIAALAAIASAGGGWSDLTGSVGPSITVPLAGDYDISAGATGTWAVSANAYHALGATVGGVSSYLDQYTEVSGSIFGGNQGLNGDMRATAVAANTLIKLQYANPGAGNSSTPNFSNRWLRVSPVRVG